MTTSMPLDRDTFEAQTQRHRRELHVHCYRMTGSFEEAEDLVQETYLRAWRKRDQYAGRASVRAWLYRIATNACLDALDKRPRVPERNGEVRWLQPYPDHLLDEISSGEDTPDAVVVARETIELTFLAAIQHLAPLPRAVLVLRDVLGCSAKETADVLETTVASVNSALQRARGGLRDHLPEQRVSWPAGVDATAAERDLLERYLAASEATDVAALKALLHEDVRFTMPPIPGLWQGREAVVDGWVAGGFGSEAFGAVRCVTTRVNRQPAIACYVRGPGDEAFRALAVEALWIADGAVADIVTFGSEHFARLGLAAEL